MRRITSNLLVKIIFTLCSFMVLLSCSQPMDLFSPDIPAPPEGYGRFSLRISDNISRDIMPPDINNFDDMYFVLEFTPQPSGSPIKADFIYNDDPAVVNGIYYINLPGGTYDLEVIVYSDKTVFDNTELPLLHGSLPNITVIPNMGVERTVVLSPFTNGAQKGRFEWDIALADFPAGIYSALMTVTKYNDTTESFYPVTESTDESHYLTNYELLDEPKDGVDLPSGYYLVLIVFKKTGSQDYEHIQALHVYQNMTSEMKSAGFSNVHFNAWNVFVREAGDITDKVYNTLADALDDITAPGNYTVKVADHASLPAVYAGGGAVSITIESLNASAPAEIKLIGKGSLVTVPAGVTLTLKDGVELTSIPYNDAPLVYVEGGSFIMEGGIIKNNKNNTPASNGGGVFISAGGSFIMEDGIIIGNASTNGGGGVSVGAGCSFIMEDGKISSNTSTNGGGVFVSAGGSFIMKDGTINDNVSVNGGGVYGEDNSIFTKTGGIIYGENAGGGNTNNVYNVEGNAAYYASTPAKIKTDTAGVSNDLDYLTPGVLGGWDPIVLSGTVSITGTWTAPPKVGDTLEADTTSLNGTGFHSYQWKRGGTDITGATNSTYVLTASDEGQNITVTVTGSVEYKGSVTSTAVNVGWD